MTELVDVVQRVALLTQHGKERVIAQALEPVLGCRVEHVTGYDTDQLGTFTREVTRPGSQIDAARRKARIGMEMSGLPVGLASEGSFGPDPVTGMLPWNVEIVLWIDDVLGIEVAGVSAGKSNFSHRLTAAWEDAKVFAQVAGFPHHRLVARPERKDDPRIRKGIADWADLKAAFHWACGETASGSVFLETDMRAHANPTRMENIRAAAEDLARKMASPCPACGVPGFWLVERVTGLPCADCGAPTRETRAQVYGCPKCEHRAYREWAHPRYADPGRCDYCNP